MSERHFVLSDAEYLMLENTLTGMQEELEELMKEIDWYTSELPDRVETCLEILRTCETPF